MKARIIFLITIIGFAFCPMLKGQDFKNYFWKWSNYFPSIPQVTPTGNEILLTTDSLMDHQVTVALYAIPIYLEDDFTAKFTLNFGTNSSGGEGITFNVWGLESNNCSQLHIGGHLINPSQIPNIDSLKNQIFWNYTLAKIYYFTEAALNQYFFGNYLAIYNIANCFVRPTISFEFDSNGYMGSGDTLNKYCSDRIAKVDSISYDHMAVTGIGVPYNFYLTPRFIANTTSVKNGVDFEITISWNYQNKTFNIISKNLSTNQSNNSTTNVINFPQLMSRISSTFSSKIAFIGFTATTSSKRNKQRVKNFSFKSKYNVPNGGL